MSAIRSRVARKAARGEAFSYHDRWGEFSHAADSNHDRAPGAGVAALAVRPGRAAVHRRLAGMAGVQPVAGPEFRWGDPGALRRRRFPGLSCHRATPPAAAPGTTARLSLGVENEIVLVVDNLSGRRCSLLLRDLPPPAFPATPALLEVAAPGHGQARRPIGCCRPERGNFAFGDLAVRCRGPLGLAEADRLVPLGEPVQVYPNLLEVRRYEALVRTTLVRQAATGPNGCPGPAGSSAITATTPPTTITATSAGRRQRGAASRSRRSMRASIVKTSSSASTWAG